MQSTVLKPRLPPTPCCSSLFLYAPFFVLGILSFQTGPEGGPQFPIEQWSTYWYRHIFGLTPPSRIAPLPIGAALIRSLTLAFMTTVVSTVLGVLSAQAFRRRFKGSGSVFYLIVLGMMVPGVLVGPRHGAGGERAGHRPALVEHGLRAARGLHLPVRFPRHAGDLQPLRRLGGGSGVVARRLAGARPSAR